MCRDGDAVRCVFRDAGQRAGGGYGHSLFTRLLSTRCVGICLSVYLCGVLEVLVLPAIMACCWLVVPSFIFYWQLFFLFTNNRLQRLGAGSAELLQHAGPWAAGARAAVPGAEAAAGAGDGSQVPAAASRAGRGQHIEVQLMIAFRLAIKIFEIIHLRVGK